MKHIVIFASGSGSNAENVIRHFVGSNDVSVAAVFTNKATAGVIERAESFGVPVIVFSKDELSGQGVLKSLRAFDPSLIVLAGFLLKFPQNLIEAFPGRIINIHPALLPKYGGKGMYGMNVHRAVLDNRDTETGITIHYIDEHYDEGDVIFQKSVTLSGDETCDEISEKVQQLEHEHFPKVIEQLLLEQSDNL